MRISPNHKILRIHCFWDLSDWFYTRIILSIGCTLRVFCAGYTVMQFICWILKTIFFYNIVLLRVIYRTGYAPKLFYFFDILLEVRIIRHAGYMPTIQYLLTSAGRFKKGCRPSHPVPPSKGRTLNRVSGHFIHKSFRPYNTVISPTHRVVLPTLPSGFAHSLKQYYRYTIALGVAISINIKYVCLLAGKTFRAGFSK